MNIVWLTPELPYPANTGGRIVVYNRIRQLNKQGNRIHLISIVDNMEELELLEIKKICDDVTLIDRNKNKVKNFIKSIRTPYCVASRTFSEITNKVDNLINNRLCDVVFCEFPQMALNIMDLKSINQCKCVLSLHNIESNSMDSLASSIGNKIKRFIYKFESRRLRVIEDKIAATELFDAVCFVSDNDLGLFKQRYPGYAGKLWLSPIGANECETYRKTAASNIICVGKMNYPPNIAGVIWLANKVMPKVLNEIPNAMFYIVGKDPTDEVKKLANSYVVVTGTVDSVREYYEKADVTVLPIFEGGGVKTKLIEAASYKVPIVSTSFGVLGTIFGDSDEIILADSVEGFAAGIVRCIKQQEASREMVNIAYNKFIRHYTWNGICAELQNKLSNL